MKRPSQPDLRRNFACRSPRFTRLYWRLFWTRFCERLPSLCCFLEDGRKAVFRFDPEVLEAQSAALCGCAALRLGLRALWGQSNLSSSAPLTSLLPFWVWSLLFALMGLSHVVGLATGRLSWRATGAMLGVLVWSFVAVMMTLDGLTGPGTVLFPIVAISEAWIYLRLTTCCSKDGFEDLPTSHLNAGNARVSINDERINGEKAEVRRGKIAEPADI